MWGSTGRRWWASVWQERTGAPGCRDFGRWPKRRSPAWRWWPICCLRRHAGASGRYDDAVVRLVRAVELFGTVRLQQAHGIDIRDPDQARLPEALRAELAVSRDRWPGSLELSYHMLEALGDPVGRLFARRRAVLREALACCRDSLLLSGSAALDEQEYEAVRNRLEGFLHEAARVVAASLHAPQLPRSEVLEWVELGPAGA